MSSTQLKKGVDEIDFFFITIHALYFGSNTYSYIPLTYLTNCSYNGSLLEIKYWNKRKEFMMKSVNVQRTIIAAAKSAIMKTEENIKQLREGMYFVIDDITNTCNTNKGRTKKMLWTDHTFLYISNSKCNTRNGIKIKISEIRRIIVEYNAYKIVVVGDGIRILIYSSDFYKVRQFVVGLEYLCINSQESKYIAKPESSISLLFRKALYLFKVVRERWTYKDLFTSIKASVTHKPIEVRVKELYSSDFNDTKKIPSQLISSVHPQISMKESKIKLRRQLSIYSEHNEAQSVCESLKAKLPSTQASKNYYGKDIRSSETFIEHSFSADKSAEVSNIKEEIEFETARFKRPINGSTSVHTEPAFKNCLEISEDDLVAKYNSLKEKANLSQEIIHKQNIQLKKLEEKCEIQKKKISQLKVIV